jgi:hypothetical protein
MGVNVARSDHTHHALFPMQGSLRGSKQQKNTVRKIHRIQKKNQGLRNFYDVCTYFVV